MKTLIILDGVYSDAKTAVCEILKRIEQQNLGRCLLYKYSTKIKKRGEVINDLKYICPNEAKEHFDEYKRNSNSKWICYQYPIFEKEEDKSKNETFYYCIDTTQIDEYIQNSNIDMGFIIVRNRRCIKTLIERYEKDINIRTVFLYTDYNYISQVKPLTNTEINIKKWKSLFDDYISSRVDHDPNYDDVLIFGCHQNYEIDKKDLMTQINAQVSSINTCNVNVQKIKDSFIPTQIKTFYIMDKFQKNYINHKSNVFIMMKYHGDNSDGDLLYKEIKTAFSEFNKENNTNFSCVRADEQISESWFPEANPDIRYWLCTYMCDWAIAIFEKGFKKIKLNANVIYEIGLMKQQGKHIEILVPASTKQKDVQLFFDLKNNWIKKYNKKNPVKKGINQCLNTIKQMC